MTGCRVHRRRRRFKYQGFAGDSHMEIADMHCDTITEIGKRKKGGEDLSLFSNSLHLDLERMKQGGYVLQNFAIFTHLEKEKDPLAWCREMIRLFDREIGRFSDVIRPARSYEDIVRNKKEGKMSAVLTIEEGAVCQGDLSVLRELYQLGARMMTMTWNFPNCLGWPNRRDEKTGKWYGDPVRGLTETGIMVLEEMEALGMIPDVSHLSDKGILDVLAHTKKPFAASHSNARAVASHPRNLTDEMIRKISERGGVIGVNFYSSFLRDWKEGEQPVSQVKDMVRHIRHMRQTGGIQCIGLGSDFDGFQEPMEMDGPDKLTLLEHELHKEGFRESEIEAVFSGNVMRLYKETLQ